MVSAAIRHQYVEEIRVCAKVQSESLLKALSTVPREDYAGSGPWKIVGWAQPQPREVAEPSELYRDVAIFLDASKTLVNGNPSTLAPWIEALNLSGGKSVYHLGCGAGYYTAIIAEMVGTTGSVLAAEVDETLAAR